MQTEMLVLAITLSLLLSPVLTGVGEGAIEHELGYENDNEIEENNGETHELTIHYDHERTHLISVNETYEIYPGDTFTFEHNTTVDIMAFPIHGWTFDQWGGNTENIENVSASETTITMEDDYHIEPEFVKAEKDNVTFEVSDAEGPVEGAELFLYVEAELYGEESDYIAETDEDGIANVTDVPLGDEYHYFYRVYKTGYQGIDTHYGPIEEDVTIDDIVLEEAEETFNLTIEEPENEGILALQHIGTERVDPETWPFEREYGNNTGVAVFMVFDEENKTAPYKMYQDGDLVHDNFEIAHHPAELEMTENITLEPHFTELNHFATRIEGEGNITVEGMVEPYDDEFEELEPIEEQDADYVPEAVEYRLTAEPEEGHEFIEWYDEKEENTYSEDRTLTQHFEEDINITARFTKDTHTLTIMRAGEGSIELEDEEITVPENDSFEDEFDEGTTVSLEAFPAEDWHFFEWLEFEDGKAVDVYSESPDIDVTMDQNITLEAVFAEYKLTLGVEGEGQVVVDARLEGDDEWMEFEGSPVEDEFTTYIADEELEFRLTAEPEEGYEFVEWYDEKEEDTYSTDKTFIPHIEEDVDITSRFREHTHDVNLTLRDADSDILLVVGAQVELECNETGEIEYETESEDDGIAYFTNVTEGEYQYTIIHKDYEEKTGNITVDEYIEKDIHLESLPTYRLDVTQRPFDRDGVIAITAHGEKEEYEADGFKVDYPEGTEIQVEAVPGDGWEFSHWEEDYPENKSEEASFNLTMNEERNITAHFDELYGLGVDIVGEGDVYIDGDEIDTPFGEEYLNGTELTLTAEPAEDWHFFHWHREDPDTEEIYTYSHEEEIDIIMDEEYILVPEFREHSFELNIEGEGKVIMEIPEDDTWVEHPDSPVEDEFYSYVDDGAEVRLTAEPAEGHELVEWDGYDEDEKVITFASEGDMDITALFQEEAPELDIEWVEDLAVDGETDEIEIEEGDEVEITAELENVGDESSEIVLEVNGDEIVSWDIEYGDTLEVDETYEFEDEREYEVTITGDYVEDQFVTVDVEEEDVETYELTLTIEGEAGRVEWDTLPIEEQDDDETEEENTWILTYEEGTEVELEAIQTDEDYEFLEWTGDVENEDEVITITMDEDKEITANFEDGIGLGFCIGILLVIVVILVIIIVAVLKVRKGGEEEDKQRPPSSQQPAREQSPAPPEEEMTETPSPPEETAEETEEEFFEEEPEEEL